MEFGNKVVQFIILNAIKYLMEDHSLLSIDVSNELDYEIFDDLLLDSITLFDFSIDVDSESNDDGGESLCDHIDDIMVDESTHVYVVEAG